MAFRLSESFKKRLGKFPFAGKLQKAKKRRFRLPESFKRQKRTFPPVGKLQNLKEKDSACRRASRNENGVFPPVGQLGKNGKTELSDRRKTPFFNFFLLLPDFPRGECLKKQHFESVLDDGSFFFPLFHEKSFIRIIQQIV